MTLHGEADKDTYVRLAPVAEGSSEVWVGYHDVFGAHVVQKVVPVSPGVPDAVVNEPRLLQQVDHPRIPAIHEAQHTPGKPGRVTFVMSKVGELSAGRALVAGHLLSVGDALSVALDVTAALCYLRDRHGLLHRDIKPDNIRLDADCRRAWLVDLQYAGKVGADGSVTAVATPPPYMAPEVPATGRYTDRSEVFAVSAVLYELVTGQVLLAGSSPEAAEQRVHAGRRPFADRAYEAWPVHVPERLRAAIRKGVRADPDRRHASVAALRAELLRLRLVDWCPMPDGRSWEGWWPPGRDTGDRIAVDIKVEAATSGKNAGRDRATARYRPGAAARRLPGLPDRFTDGDDAALSRFFRDVETRVAQLRPT